MFSKKFKIAFYVVYHKKDLLKLRIYNCNHSKTLFGIFCTAHKAIFLPQLIIRCYLCILSMNLALEFSAEYKKLNRAKKYQN